MADDRLHLDGAHSVLTPEYVEFDFVLAGMLSRFLAWFTDTLVTVALSIAVVLLPFFALYIGAGVLVLGGVLFGTRKFGAQSESANLTTPIAIMALGAALLLGGIAMHIVSPAIGIALVFVLYFLVD